jgi:monofunctional biosynthetic peptidoglycan transglycosylase
VPTQRLPTGPLRPVRSAHSKARHEPRRRAGGLRRTLIRALLILLLAPAALIGLYRFLPPPLTPLMMIRLAEGEGLRKDWVPLDQMAPVVPQAVIAAEDNLFCRHWGFDVGSLKGEIEDYMAGRPARGASTMTMQTAKNLFLWPDRSMLRKAIEAWLTPQIELLWPKRRILEVYLNVVELGPGIYGVEAAAQAYFGKPAAALTSREAALLAAVLPNPRQWSPATPTRYLNSRAQTIRTRIGQLGPLLDCAR